MVNNAEDAAFLVEILILGKSDVGNAYMRSLRGPLATGPHRLATGHNISRQDLHLSATQPIFPTPFSGA